MGDVVFDAEAVGRQEIFKKQQPRLGSFAFAPGLDDLFAGYGIHFERAVPVLFKRRGLLRRRWQVKANAERGTTELARQRRTQSHAIDREFKGQPKTALRLCG